MFVSPLDCFLLRASVCRDRYEGALMFACITFL